MFTIDTNFIGEFKTGDNINHNLAILAVLYSGYEDADEYEKKLLCKPIIILLASIIEAVLHDFHVRTKSFTSEGVKGLAFNIIEYIRGKKMDKFETYIESAYKHDLFDQPDKFYDYLHRVRKLRNRVHIQNTKNYFEPDEIKAFTEKRKTVVEKLLEVVLKKMSDKYPRTEFTTIHVDDFQLPWDEHYS